MVWGVKGLLGSHQKSRYLTQLFGHKININVKTLTNYPPSILTKNSKVLGSHINFQSNTPFGNHPASHATYLLSEKKVNRDFFVNLKNSIISNMIF